MPRTEKAECFLGSSGSDSENNDCPKTRLVRLRKGNKKKEKRHKTQQEHPKENSPAAQQAAAGGRGDGGAEGAKEELAFLSVFFSHGGRGTAYSYAESKQRMQTSGLYKQLVVKNGSCVWEIGPDVHALALVVSLPRKSISTPPRQHTHAHSTSPRSLRQYSKWPWHWRCAFGYD